MDRKKFQNMFSQIQIDEFLIGAICDDIELCEEIEYPVYSRYFYSPYFSTKVKDLTIGNIVFAFCGINDECEKNMIAVYPKDFPKEELNFPLKYFKIINKSKFKELEHKDYLGAIMSLGLKREVMGDLIVKNSCCYGVITEDIFSILLENLKEVGRNPVEVKEILKSEIPLSEYKEIVESVSSLRLDNIIGSIGNFSRNKGLEIIENGDVSVNYSIEKEKSRILKEGDTITIKKRGKFILDKCIGESRKGKLRVVIKKFS